jgi:polyisoprenoid-binding protein YceI
MNDRIHHTKRMGTKNATDARGVFFCGFCLFVFFVVNHSIPVSLSQRAKPKPSARIYTFDAAQSQIVVTLTQEGMISKRYPTHRVVAKSFSGKIELPTDETKMAVALEAEAKAMTNADEAMSEFERKGFHDVLRNTVLEAEKFPAIAFTSASVTNVKRSGNQRTFTLAGDLALHGVTRRLSFPVQVTMAGDQIRATGEAKLKQSDFDMKPFERGMGLIKISDETKVSFTIVAKVQ